MIPTPPHPTHTPREILPIASTDVKLKVGLRSPVGIVFIGEIYQKLHEELIVHSAELVRLVIFALIALLRHKL